MNGLLIRSFYLRSAVLLGVALAGVSVWAQAPGAPLSGPGGNNMGSGSRSSSPNARPSMEQQQESLIITGRILTPLNRPVGESLSVELVCGIRPLQVVHTDLDGYFTFSFGSGGAAGNLDFSASNETPSFERSANASARVLAGSLTGCELRLSVSGFYPVNYSLTQGGDTGRIEIGTLHLRRIDGEKGSAISVTSLLVPDKARKEYEKAMKELQSNHADRAEPHLEKAISLYDKYAAAWNALGEVRLNKGEKPAATEAFQKAIAADPDYVPPYVSLTSLQLEAKQWDAAGQTAAKALELDPSSGFAGFAVAVADYNLDRLDAAEKSAREAEKNSADIPQLHALLADILLQKENYPQAAGEMRTYLQTSPQGQFAEEIRQRLPEVEKLAAEQTDAQSSALPTASPEAASQPEQQSPAPTPAGGDGSQ